MASCPPLASAAVTPPCSQGLVSLWVAQESAGSCRFSWVTALNPRGKAHTEQRLPGPSAVGAEPARAPGGAGSTWPSVGQASPPHVRCQRPGSPGSDGDAMLTPPPHCGTTPVPEAVPARAPDTAVLYAQQLRGPWATGAVVFAPAGLASAPLPWDREALSAREPPCGDLCLSSGTSATPRGAPRTLGRAARPARPRRRRGSPATVPYSRPVPASPRRVPRQPVTPRPARAPGPGVDTECHLMRTALRGQRGPTRSLFP